MSEPTTRKLTTSLMLEVPGVEIAVADGPDRGASARLSYGLARIGTAAGSQLRLSDSTVSGLHCEVSTRSGSVVLVDRGSTNGTLVDGVRVTEAFLHNGALVRIGNTTLRVRTLDEPERLPLSPRKRFGGLLGSSPQIRAVYAVLERAAATDFTVLIGGETGTGKELVARALHEESRRKNEPFVVVDCGAVPDNLIASELFGHVRGAFTGAVDDRQGAFEQAHGGTLFFDEVGELPLSLQPHLLRVLETRQFRRVGGNDTRTVDVRVVAATNRELQKSIHEGTFRDDLFYRLAVIDVELPPLRARREDIPVLAQHFYRQFAGDEGALSPELVAMLTQRAWPGNVRELRNFVQRAMSLGWTGGGAPAPKPHSSGQGIPTHLPLKEARVEWMQRFDALYLQALLEKAGGNVTRAAELAGINRRSFHRLLKRLGVGSETDAVSPAHDD